MLGFDFSCTPDILAVILCLVLSNYVHGNSIYDKPWVYFNYFVLLLIIYILAFVGVKYSKNLFGHNKILSLKARKISFKAAGKIIYLILYIFYIFGLSSLLYFFSLLM